MSDTEADFSPQNDENSSTEVSIRNYNKNSVTKVMHKNIMNMNKGQVDLVKLNSMPSIM